MKGISRMDHGRTHGWFVRAYRNYKVYSKLFSDRKFGGKGKALAEAKGFLLQLSAEIAKEPAIRKPFRTKAQPNNKLGVVGVSETSKKSGSGKLMPCFTVYWRGDDGKARNYAFYFSRYGTREAALKAAVAWRHKLEKEKMTSLGLKPADLKKEREVQYARAQPLVDAAPPAPKKAAAKKPAAKKPAATKPAATKPAATKPVAKKPAAKKA